MAALTSPTGCLNARANSMTLQLPRIRFVAGGRGDPRDSAAARAAARRFRCDSCRKCQRPEPQQSAVTTKAAKSSPKKAAPPAKPMLEPKAIDILKTACARLAAAHSMTFTAVVTFESPSLRTLIENGNPGSITVTGEHTGTEPCLQTAQSAASIHIRMSIDALHTAVVGAVWLPHICNDRSLALGANVPVNLLMYMVIATAIYAVGPRKSLVAAVTILALSSVAIRLLYEKSPAVRPVIFSHGLSFALMALVAVTIVVRVFKAREITAEIIVGAVCVYSHSRHRVDVSVFFPSDRGARIHDGAADREPRQ